MINIDLNILHLDTYFFVFSLSLIFNYLLIIFQPKMMGFGIDKGIGVQKVHKQKSLRLGGLVIVLTSLLGNYIFVDNSEYFLRFYISISPIFFIGLLEDITQKISIKLRLIASIVSSFLLVNLTESVITSLFFPIINIEISSYFFLISFTVFGFVAICNAFNFIDGLNGLTSGISFVILLFFSYFAQLSGKLELFNLLLIFSFSVLAFWILNVITGKIFLGDTGAYCLGFLIGWCGVELTIDNEFMSPWAVFLIIIYPALELIFSTLRRLVNKSSPLKPDNKHLHSLFFIYLSSVYIKNKPNFVNSLCGFILTIFGIIPSLYVYIVSANEYFVFIGIIIFLISYIILLISLTILTKKNKLI